MWWLQTFVHLLGLHAGLFSDRIRDIEELGASRQYGPCVKHTPWSFCTCSAAFFFRVTLVISILPRYCEVTVWPVSDASCCFYREISRIVASSCLFGVNLSQQSPRECPSEPSGLTSYVSVFHILLCLRALFQIDVWSKIHLCRYISKYI